MTSHQLRAALALLFSALAAGCGLGSDAASDSAASDAGYSKPADAGGWLDAGRAVDASQPPDASPAADAGRADSGASGSDAGTAPLACSNLPLCDGFEGASAGGPPDSKLWTLTAESCQGTTQIAIDGTMAHSGSQSVKVTGKGNYCNHLFLSNASALASLGSNFYARFWVRFSDALGSDHVTFAAMKDATDGKDLRMGGQSQILMYNREINDATLPALSPTGIALSVKPSPLSWHCIEFHIDGSQGLLQTWFDGAAVDGLQIDQVSTPDVDSQWVTTTQPWRPSLQDFRLGWESYGGSDMTLWYDDIALGAARIGCQ